MSIFIDFAIILWYFSSISRFRSIFRTISDHYWPRPGPGPCTRYPPGSAPSSLPPLPGYLHPTTRTPTTADVMAAPLHHRARRPCWVHQAPFGFNTSAILPVYSDISAKIPHFRVKHHISGLITTFPGKKQSKWSLFGWAFRENSQNWWFSVIFWKLSIFSSKSGVFLEIIDIFIKKWCFLENLLHFQNQRWLGRGLLVFLRK